jgi:hypothetical protein
LNELSILELNIFPNPVLEELNIQSDFEGKLALSVTNLEGRTFHIGEIIGEKLKLNLNNWASDSYFLNINFKGQNLVRKFQVP